MKRISLIMLTAAFVATALAGCAERHSVNYYLHHVAARTREMKHCMRDHSSSYNCRAAAASFDAGPPIPVD